MLRKAEKEAEEMLRKAAEELRKAVEERRKAAGSGDSGTKSEGGSSKPELPWRKRAPRPFKKVDEGS